MPKVQAKPDTMPFDEALRRLVNTPPKHKPAKKKVKRLDKRAK